ncbi:MAG: hypothetical protein HWN65_10010 [Candidatus Helarchaeota archaeon]|nr:hypothetical protein [Candidatus Helarchaeota archaeon]
MNDELESILQQIRDEKKFTLEHLKYFVDGFNDRFWRALRNTLNNGVKKYVFKPSNRIVWIVIGNRKDYLIISNLYCNCEDFYVKVVIKKAARMCYHLLSKVLAENLNYYEKFTVEDERYDELMEEWKRY